MVGRRRVTWAWQDIAAIGVAVDSKGREFLGFRFVDGVAPPKLSFWLYPAWSAELGALILAQLSDVPLLRPLRRGPVAGEDRRRMSDAALAAYWSSSGRRLGGTGLPSRSARNSARALLESHLTALPTGVR